MKFLNPAYLLDFAIRTFFRVLITMIIYRLIKFVIKPMLILGLLGGILAFAYAQVAKAVSQPYWISSYKKEDAANKYPAALSNLKLGQNTQLLISTAIKEIAK